MLRVTVELEPFGDSSKAKRLAQICVGNITNRGRPLTYVVLVQEPEPLNGEPIDKVFKYYPDEQDRLMPATIFLSSLMYELEQALTQFSDVMEELEGARAGYFRKRLRDKR